MKSPLSIEIIIHYYTSPSTAGDYEDSQAFRSIAKDLFNKGLLLPSLKGDREYDAEPNACKAYIDALCRVPYPTHEWTMKYTPTKKEHYDGERFDTTKFLMDEVGHFNHLDNRPWWEMNSKPWDAVIDERPGSIVSDNVNLKNPSN